MSIKTTQFDRITSEGTRNPDFTTEGKPSNRIVCADGFTMSVIAGAGAYCAPRVDYPTGYATGPFWELEVGFPSVRPEPWGDWSRFQDGDGDPLETVYGYVPAEQVRALIVLHGGEAN